MPDKVAPIENGRVSTVSESLPDSELTESTCSVSTTDDEELPPLIRKTGLSATMTLINFVKGMVGPGCLSLPVAFKQSGLWCGAILVILFGFLNNYCMLQLVHCSQFLSRKKGDAHLDYGSVASEACENSFRVLRPHKNKAKFIVNTAIIALQVGICSVFYVFVGVHVQELVEQYTDFRAPTTVWFLLIAVPMILINFLRTLKAIAVFSVIGNVLMIVSLAFIFQHLIRATHVLGELPWVTSFDGVMTATGSILYSFEGQAMVLPMENRLKHPKKMVGPFGVLSLGMGLVTMVYTSCGFLGYITYGNGVSGSITLNLPSQPIFTVVKAFLTLVVFLGFVIQQYVIVDMTWPTVRQQVVSRQFPSAPALPFELLYRSLLVLLSMGIAMSIPNLEQIIPLVGVTAGMLLAFVFPAAIDTITFLPLKFRRLHKLPESERMRAKLGIAVRIVKNSILIAIGVFGSIAGLQSTLRDLFASSS